MKKLLLIPLLLICSISVFSQFQNDQWNSNAKTLVTTRGGIHADSAMIVAVFPDTTSANNGETNFYPGSIIFTTSDNLFWWRNATATAWLNYKYTVTADNGLIMSTISNVQLGSPDAPGAPLLHDTYIDGGAFGLYLTGTNQNGLFGVSETGGGSGGFPNVISSTNNIGLYTWSNGSHAAFMSAKAAATLALTRTVPVNTPDTIYPILTMYGDAQNQQADDGFGLSIDFDLRTSSNVNAPTSNQIISRWKDATFGSHESELVVSGRISTELMDLFSVSWSGLRAHRYGVGAITGDPAYDIQTDENGNFIEVAIDGSVNLDSVNNRYFDVSTLADSSGFILIKPNGSRDTIIVNPNDTEVTVENLQETTDEGNVTTNNIIISAGSVLRVASSSPNSPHIELQNLTSGNPARQWNIVTDSADHFIIRDQNKGFNRFFLDSTGNPFFPYLDSLNTPINMLYQDNVTGEIRKAAVPTGIGSLSNGSGLTWNSGASRYDLGGTLLGDADIDGGGLHALTALDLTNFLVSANSAVVINSATNLTITSGATNILSSTGDGEFTLQSGSGVFISTIPNQLNINGDQTLALEATDLVGISSAGILSIVTDSTLAVLPATTVADTLMTILDAGNGQSTLKKIAISDLSLGGSSVPLANRAFVSKSGNDGTGTVGRADLPFLTITAAIAAASSGQTVDVYDGTYDEAVIGKNGVNIHLNESVIWNRSTDDLGNYMIRDNNATAIFEISGRGKLMSTGGAGAKGVLQLEANLSRVTVRAKYISSDDGNNPNISISKGSELKLYVDTIIAPYTAVEMVDSSKLYQFGGYIESNGAPVYAENTSRYYVYNAKLNCTINDAAVSMRSNSYIEAWNTYFTSSGYNGVDLLSSEGKFVNCKIESTNSTGSNRFAILYGGGSGNVLEFSNCELIAQAATNYLIKPLAGTTGELRFLTSSWGNKPISPTEVARITYGLHNLQINNGDSTDGGHATVDSGNVLHANQHAYGTPSNGDFPKYNSTSTKMEFGNLNTELATKVDKSQAAYKMVANNTNATADMATHVFRHVGNQNLPTVSWSGTPPTTVVDSSYNWTQTGNTVTISWYINYTNAGTSANNFTFDLPSDLPTPLAMTSVAANVILYTGSGVIATINTSSSAAAGRSFLKRSSANTHYEIVTTMASGVSAKTCIGTLTYTAQ